jgi:co-chaperonin GroES (HSP10)
LKDKPQTTANEIIAGLGDALTSFEPFHNQILIGIWMRPEKTAGGIIMPDKVLDEDRWQGKVGIVLKKGPLAFVDDSRNDFAGQNIEIGDWVIFRVSDGFAIDVNGVHCRMVEDIHIRGRVTSPNIIW